MAHSQNIQKENIIKTINGLRDEIINMTVIVIRRLQEKNKNLRKKSNRLEFAVDVLEQYGRRNNTVLTGTLNVSNNDLEDTLTSVLSDIGVNMGKNDIILFGILDVSNCDLKVTMNLIISNITINVTGNNIEACHRVGKPFKKYRSQKMTMHFVSRKISKKALLNKKGW